MQIKYLMVPETKIIEDISLPSDFSRSIPSTGKVWLYKYGLTDSLISKMGIGYSEKYNRLILPCYQDEDLIYYQGRYLGNYKKDGTAKYISCTKKGNFHWTFNPHQSNIGVLVEDMLSAIKVGLAGYAGIALFGSYIKEKTVSNIAGSYDQLAIWLDPDKMGYAAKSKKRLTSLGYNVVAVLTADKDPKDFNSEEIQKFLLKTNTITHSNNVCEGDKDED